MIKTAYLFLGPPGSGKGTQAQLLAERNSVSHIDVGSALRLRASKNDVLGNQISKVMKQGNTVNNIIVNTILEEELDKLDNQNVVLDGYCRNEDQADHLLKLVNDKIIQNLICIFINISQEEIIKRITLRRYCRYPDKSLKLISNDIQKEECVKLGGIIEKRADDNLETVNSRLEVYNKQTLPAINMLSKICKIFNIDGDGSIEDISKRITNVVDGIN